MKVSLNWLTDYVDVSIPAEELGELLTGTGLNCEEILRTDNDIILDLEVTSNRPDCLGHLGVAREVAAATGAAFRPPEIGSELSKSTSGKVADFIGVEVLAADLCPRYTARLIRGVKVAPSPPWLVERLEAVGLRSVNNIVDVTNYVLMEYSQPLHGFDYDAITGRRIVVRRARDGEHLIVIDGSKCRLDESMLVIADTEEVVAIAGIMGGLDTEVSGATTNVLIESAQFDPLSVRRTSRKLALMSESNYRFERGVDPVGLDAASLRACGLILELAGGQLAAGVVDVWASPYSSPKVSLRPGRCNALLGVEIPVDEQVAILRRLGLSPKPAREEILCTIPPHRGDLTREADLIEEVARLVGYERIPLSGKVTHAVVNRSRNERVRRQIGQVMAAGGFDEAMTYTFIDAEEAELFGWAETVRVDATVRKTNNALRPTLIPSLLRACKVNQDAGGGEVSLYELAGVFRPGDGRPTPPDEHVELAMVTTRRLRELRGAIEEVVERLAPAARLDIARCAVPGLDGDTSAEIRLDSERVGTIGCVAGDVQEHYGLERTVAAAAMRFEPLLDKYQEKRTYSPMPRFPAVRRDLSVILDEAVTWTELLEVVEAVSQPIRVSVDYVTTYRGEPVDSGQKSVTLTLTYRSASGTLRSEQVDEQVGRVVEALKEKLSASLRA